MNGTVISYTPVIRGIGISIGMHVPLKPFTIYKEEPIEEHFTIAYDYSCIPYTLTLLHIKSTDDYSHCSNLIEKINILKRVDRYIYELIKKFYIYNKKNSKNLILCICGDHSTPTIINEHTADPVPILISIFNSVFSDTFNSFTYSDDDIQSTDTSIYFSERWFSCGSLQRIRGENLLPILFNIAEKIK